MKTFDYSVISNSQKIQIQIQFQKSVFSALYTCFLDLLLFMSNAVSVADLYWQQSRLIIGSTCPHKHKHIKTGPLELTGQSAARSEERAALLLVQEISFRITGSAAVLSGKRRRIKKSGGGEEKTVKKALSRLCIKTFRNKAIVP